jgi:formylglycine-generating enzyme required for sulfatase activity
MRTARNPLGVALGLVMAAWAGCSFDLQSGAYTCEVGDPKGCPSGFTCVSGLCERGDGAGGGGGLTVDAGSDGGLDAGSDAGSDAGTRCEADEHVVDHACVACAAGTTRPSGDDPSGDDTACAGPFCAADEHVADHACVACAAGTTRPSGDDASGDDTACAAVLCDEDEHVDDHACVACVPGSTRPAGDDATGGDTFCTEVLCGENERVSLHRCVPCAPGTIRPAGDDATGDNTVCAVWTCAQDEHVVDHACVACPPENSNTAGDLATGDDTICDGVRCASDQHVQSNACVPCDPGTSRPAGDDPLGADTACAVVVCDEGEHVEDHACVACPTAWTRPAGDEATGADTSCDDLIGFVRIEAGTFTMGSPAAELGRDANEVSHQVTLTEDFWIQTTEVTQAAFVEVMGHNPSSFTSCGASCPAEQVSWWNAAAFANERSSEEGLFPCYHLTGCTGTLGTTSYECTGVALDSHYPSLYQCIGYRLPTEAEWEYAARAGTTTATYDGDLTVEGSCPESTLDPIAWFRCNATTKTFPVGQKSPNAWGLYDMLGNVAEWTTDLWVDMLPSSAVTDPFGGLGAASYTTRGGTYSNYPDGVRAAARAFRSPGTEDKHYGFRLVRTVHGSLVIDPE